MLVGNRRQPEGIIIDPTERHVRYYVVESHGWFKTHRYLLPQAPMRLDPDCKALHVDLFALDLTQEMVADIPLVFSGVAPVIEQEGAILLAAMDHLKVRALPAAKDISRPLLWGAAGTIVVYAVHGLFDSPYWTNDLSVEFWLVVALAVVAMRAGSPTAPPDPSSRAPAIPTRT